MDIKGDSDPVREEKMTNLSRPSSMQAVPAENSNSEYLEFLELNEQFSGERLQKLIRKVE
jgi:hypothetical protein